MRFGESPVGGEEKEGKLAECVEKLRSISNKVFLVRGSEICNRQRSLAGSHLLKLPLPKIALKGQDKRRNHYDKQQNGEPASERAIKRGLQRSDYRRCLAL